MRALLFFISIGVLSLLNAQGLKEMSPIMQSRMASINEDLQFSLFVKGNGTAFEQTLIEKGIDKIGSVKGYSLIKVDKAKLNELIDSGSLTYLGLSMRSGTPLNDQMINNNNILPLHQGVSPLEHPLKGEGVLIGIIDTGIELLHPDFQRPDGSTRVLKLWDQTFIYDPAHIPQPYGFGTEWTAAEIDAGQAIHQDQLNWFGHGSTVTGTACGDGSALNKYAGVAPMADMLIVSFDFGRPDFLADVVSSVQYLFDEADALELPCVINMSLGDYYGSHDGNDPAALYIDSLLEAKSGRAVVAAVGNSNGLAPYHLHNEVDSDTSFTWFESEAALLTGTPGVLFELWADIEDFQEVEFAIAVDKPGTVYQKRAQGNFHDFNEMLGVTVSEDLMNVNGDVLAEVHYWAQLQGDQVQLQAYIPAPDSSGYLYRFMATGAGSYDIWSTSTFGTSDMVQQAALPSISNFPDIVNYVLPDKRMHMVSSWTCSEKVITVANYVNRSTYVNYLNDITSINEAQGAIAVSSSSGPTRDGVLKPDVAATGTVTLSTGNFAMLEQLIQNEPHKVAQGGLHFRNAGSSMASPVVAGIAALFFEQCPQATWEDLKIALFSHSAGDLNTGTLPNERWGHGKADGFGTIASFSMAVDISIQAGSLVASGGTVYAWYLDGEPIEGGETGSLPSLGQGAYSCEVSNELGCSRFTETLVVTAVTEIDPAHLSIGPNPSQGNFRVQGLQAGQNIAVCNLLGQSVPFRISPSVGDWLLDMTMNRAGTYLLYIGKEESGQGIKLIIAR